MAYAVKQAFPVTTKTATIYCLPTMCQELCQGLISTPHAHHHHRQQEIVSPTLYTWEQTHKTLQLMSGKAGF